MPNSEIIRHCFLVFSVGIFCMHYATHSIHRYTHTYTTLNKIIKWNEWNAKILTHFQSDTMPLLKLILKFSSFRFLVRFICLSCLFISEYLREYVPFLQPASFSCRELNFGVRFCFNGAEFMEKILYCLESCITFATFLFHFSCQIRNVTAWKDNAKNSKKKRRRRSEQKNAS